MICFINRTTVDYDIRLQKYVNACIEHDVPYCVIAWDRIGQCEKVFPNEYQYKAYAPYGNGWKNIISLIGWIFFQWRQLFKLRAQYKVIHACNIENCLSALPAKLFGKKLVMDIYDTKNPQIEAKLAKRIDGLILPSDERLKQVGVTKGECKNYLEVENVPYFDQTIELKDYVEFPQKIHLAYVGIMEREIRGLENVLELVKSDERFIFDVAGTGSGLDEEVKKAAAECPRIKYYGKVDYKTALRLERDADFIVALYYLKAKVHEYASPNKYYESLYLGKPVITSKGTLVGNNVEKNDTGYTIGETVDDLRYLFKNISNDDFIMNYNKKVHNCTRLWKEKYDKYYETVTRGEYFLMMKRIVNC